MEGVMCGRGNKYNSKLHDKNVFNEQIVMQNFSECGQNTNQNGSHL